MCFVTATRPQNKFTLSPPCASSFSLSHSFHFRLLVGSVPTSIQRWLLQWQARTAGCSVFWGRCVSGNDCAGGREVNWKKLCCSRRGAEARGNKLDISPIHVGWRVYTVYPPRLPSANSHKRPLWEWLTEEMEPGHANVKHYHAIMQYIFTYMDTLALLDVMRSILYF